MSVDIAFPIAFVTLILATGNILLAFLAIVSVGGIVACVLGMCKSIGWELGTGEAIAGVMVIDQSTVSPLFTNPSPAPCRLGCGLHHSLGPHV